MKTGSLINVHLTPGLRTDYSSFFAHPNLPQEAALVVIYAVLVNTVVLSLPDAVAL